MPRLFAFDDDQFRLSGQVLSLDYGYSDATIW